MGPRGAYLSAGAKGVYYRESLGLGKGSGASKSQSRGRASAASADTTPSKTGTRAEYPTPGGYAPTALLAVAAPLLLMAGLVTYQGGLVIAIGIAAAIAAILLGRRQYQRNAALAEYRTLLERLTAHPDKDLLTAIGDKQTDGCLNIAAWRQKHEGLYSGILQSAMEDGIDVAEKEWLFSVARALKIDRIAIHVEVLKPLLWELMSDSEISEDEEQSVSKVMEALEVSQQAIPEEWDAIEQFIRARKMRSEMPVVEAPISLQRNETCHHITRGAFMDMKVLRSYTQGGEKMKEEGLVVAKEGDIYITSKRILMVGDGTSSIPHEKVLDIEIDEDQKLITLTKDGRQKPLYIRVTDTIYLAKLLEHLSQKN